MRIRLQGLVVLAAAVAVSRANSSLGATGGSEPDLPGDSDVSIEDLVEGEDALGPVMDVWSPCFRDICSPFLPYRALKSSCLTGCRSAVTGGLDHKEDCEEYCNGVIDLPMVIETGEKIEDADLRDQWIAVCTKGCVDGWRVRDVFEVRMDKLETEVANKHVPLP